MAGCHMFDIDVAMDVGVNAAILFENIADWISRYEQKSVNFKDGKYWTVCSIEEFLRMFPYMSAKTIRTALNRLEESGYIITGKYNMNKFNRTKWYAIGEKGIIAAGGDRKWQKT